MKQTLRYVTNSTETTGQGYYNFYRLILYMSLAAQGIRPYDHGIELTPFSIETYRDYTIHALFKSVFGTPDFMGLKFLCFYC